jgi:hypothetical protein
MSFTGPQKHCVSCGSPRIRTQHERFDMTHDPIAVTGQQLCDACGTSLIYSRRATNDEVQLMAKTTRRSNKPTKTKPTKATRTSKKPAPAPRTARAATPTPRRQRLPEMEDSAIAELDAIAVEYAEIRDQRMGLTRDEVQLKANALRAMKKHGRTVYRHAGIKIMVTPGEEQIKVSVTKAEADEQPETTFNVSSSSPSPTPDDDDREDGGDDPDRHPEPEPEAEAEPDEELVSAAGDDAQL